MDVREMNEKAVDLVVQAVKLINDDVDPSTQDHHYLEVGRNAHPGLIQLFEFDDATREHTHLKTYRVVLQEVY